MWFTEHNSPFRILTHVILRLNHSSSAALQTKVNDYFRENFSKVLVGTSDLQCTREKHGFHRPVETDDRQSGSVRRHLIKSGQAANIRRGFQQSWWLTIQFKRIYSWVASQREVWIYDHPPTRNLRTLFVHTKNTSSFLFVCDLCWDKKIVKITIGRQIKCHWALEVVVYKRLQIGKRTKRRETEKTSCIFLMGPLWNALK